MKRSGFLVAAVCGGRFVVGAALCLVTLWASLPAHGQSRWQEANKLVGAIGGWRVYTQERAEPPPGYPTIPTATEALLPAAVLAADPSVAVETELASWESRRFAERSVPLSAPTVTYARTRGDPESKEEIGVHLPVGSWLQRTRSLAADETVWGEAERKALELEAVRIRLILYADAVAAKAELAQAMDRLEIQKVMEELTQRQREIAAVPESDLLSLRIERIDAEDAEAAAKEAALRAAERLALEMGRPLADGASLLQRLPLEVPEAERLPDTGTPGRLDVKMAEDALSQQRSADSRSRTGPWLGGFEVGLLRERTDAGQVANTVELSWKLPFGGDERRQIDLHERLIRQAELRLRGARQIAERELAESARAKTAAGQRVQLAAQALKDAEAWMEEQVYRYSGMLIGPHELLRAAARLRAIRSRYIAARRGAFGAVVDAHFAQAIPTRIPAFGPSAPTSAPSGGAH